MRVTRLALVVALVLLPNVVKSFSVLVVSPVFAYSHVQFMARIADLLADAGHNVTFLAAHIAEHLRGKVTLSPKVQVLDYENDDEGRAHMARRGAGGFAGLWFESAKISISETSMVARILVEDFGHICQKMFRDEGFLTSLREKKFDVVIAEPFCFCGLYLADFLGIPSKIAAVSATRQVTTSYAVGQPNGLNYVPGSYSKYGAESGIWDRFNNVAQYLLTNYFHGTIFGAQFDQVSQITHGKIRHWEEILADCSLVLLNANPILEHPVPLISKVIQVGGVTYDPSAVEPLLKELDRVLNERSKTVFVSFGTVLRSADMPDILKKSLLNVFKSMSDVTFIWKYEEDDEILVEGVANVKLVKWAPQKALLADDRLALFVTHGGLSSVLETAYSGKPAVVVPLFGDQPRNAEMLAQHRSAVVVNKGDLKDAGKIAKILNDVIFDQSYTINAKKLAEMLQRQPFEPKDILVKNVEFAARFGRQSTMDPYARHLNFVQYYFLDLLLVFLVIIISLGLIIVKTYRCVSRVFGHQKSRSPNTKSKLH